MPFLRINKAKVKKHGDIYKKFIKLRHLGRFSLSQKRAHPETGAPHDYELTSVCLKISSRIDGYLDFYFVRFRAALIINLNWHGLGYRLGDRFAL